MVPDGVSEDQTQTRRRKTIKTIAPKTVVLNDFTSETRKKSSVRKNFIACVLTVSFLTLLHTAFKLNPTKPSNWSWKQHTFDCHSVSIKEEDEHHGGVFVKTNTNPSFEMNIHDPSVEFISDVIKRDGIWEGKYVETVQNALLMHPNAYLLDIGANIGMFTLVTAAMKRKTFSFEPNVRNYERLCKTVNQNVFHEYVNLFNIAATSKAQKLHQELDEKNMGGAGVEPITKEDLVNSGVGSNTVDGLPIDSLDLPTDHPFVMKIDVEGHELDAFMGATDFLKRVDIVLIMMELRPDQLKKDKVLWMNYFEIFVSKGLEPFQFDWSGHTTKLDLKKFLSWTSRKGYSNNELLDVLWKKKE